MNLHYTGGKMKIESAMHPQKVATQALSIPTFAHTIHCVTSLAALDMKLTAQWGCDQFRAHAGLFDNFCKFVGYRSLLGNFFQDLLRPAA